MCIMPELYDYRDVTPVVYYKLLKYNNKSVYVSVPILLHRYITLKPILDIC